MNESRFLKIVFKLLCLICPDHLCEEIEGDLVQRFNRDVNTFGTKKAKRRLIWNAIRFVRPSIMMRNKFTMELNSLSMFQNYFKTVSRHILKHKVNFAFKLGGLTLAIFSLIIITVYVSYQWSFDKFHTEYQNVYRVNSNRDEDGKIMQYSTVPPAIGPALKEAFPEVAVCARLGIASGVVIKYNDKLFKLKGFAEADSSIFEVLSVKFLQGDETALYQPGSIVLTESTAKQIFGDDDPINKVITSSGQSDLMWSVKAVIADFPANSHLFINALYSFRGSPNANSWQISWDGSVNLYVRMLAGANPGEVSRKAFPMLQKNLAKRDDGSEKHFSIYFQPIANIYLDPGLKMEFSKKGNATYVYIFSCLGFFLLTIACINYINLSIADFDTRTREIGVRKVLGAKRIQIGFQIIFETMIISGTALIMSIMLLYLLFPTISALLDSNLRFEMLWSENVLILMGLIVLLLVTLSAAYPSYKLASQKQVQDLKPTQSFGSNISVGRILLLIQCVISIISICTTVVIGRQIKFIHEKDLGYDRTNVVTLIMPDEYPQDRISVLKNEISNLAGVETISYSYYLMPISTYFKGWYQVEQEGKMKAVLLNEMFVDHDYFKTMNIKLADGRMFDRKYSSDATNAFIVNEMAVKELGWKNPLGKRIKVGYPGSDQGEGTIVGVVKDFNSLSLHKKIEPVVLRLQYDDWPGNCLSIKVRGSLASVLPTITSTYERLMPGFLADARILEDIYTRQYENEDKAFASLQVGTVIIILISVLGIFSLSLYMSVKRMKEFGIRKILGATIRQIASLHISYFLKIVIIANVIALPFSYWLMVQWLDDFAYRTDLSVPIFLSVMGISFLLVILSGGYSTWKAGRMNPVDVIKAE